MCESRDFHCELVRTHPSPNAPGTFNLLSVDSVSFVFGSCLAQ